ncbi:sensor histidine kinase [uncultured Aquitalea sp.]|nr:sensor histidine kinase [uncultured Aquitalea sp.]
MTIPMQKPCTEECLKTSIESQDEGVIFCKHKLSYHKRIISGRSIIICSVDVDLTSGKNSFFGTKKLYKKLRGTTDDIDRIFERIENIIQEIYKESDLIQKNTYDSLHDIDKWSGQLARLANTLIDNNKGHSFEDKYNTSSALEKSIYETATLLKDTLDLVSILHNSSATKKKKGSITIHSLLVKIATILNNSQAKEQKKKIAIKGNCFAKITLFSSFKIILLSLLDNAIKYSISNQEISAVISEDAENVYIRIETISPHIEEYERERIFEKGYRGNNIGVDAEGSGFGLYIAKLCAEANQTEITVNSAPKNALLNQKKFAHVEFIVKIPKKGI